VGRRNAVKITNKGTNRVSVLIQLVKVDDAGICTLVILGQPVNAVVAWAGCHTQIAQSRWCQWCNSRFTTVARQSMLSLSVGTASGWRARASMTQARLHNDCTTNTSSTVKHTVNILHLFFMVDDTNIKDDPSSSSEYILGVF